MASIEGDEPNGLVLGYLVETGTGPWEWENDNVRYVTIPSDDGTYYWQEQFKNATLKPFTQVISQPEHREQRVLYVCVCVCSVVTDSS